MHSRTKLADDIRALGIAAGDVVMLHASVRAVGEIAGGPDEIHLALKDVLTPKGTLLMYAGCPQHCDEVGRGNLTAEEEAEVLEKLPVFDAKTARADRSNGALVEFFRTYPGTLFNDHVARFIAWGAHAPELVAPQPWDYAYGRGSALDRFAALDGKILMLGSDHDTVTFLHHVEHIADFPDKRVVRFKVPVFENGARVWRDMEEFDTSGGAHANWSERFFAEVVDAYLRASGSKGGRIGNAESHVMRATDLMSFAVPIMQSVAAGEFTALESR